MPNKKIGKKKCKKKALDGTRAGDGQAGQLVTYLYYNLFWLYKANGG